MKNLSYVILGDNYPIWMTKCAWYAANKFLPDARIIVCLNRTNVNLINYEWVVKVKAELLLVDSIPEIFTNGEEYVFPPSVIPVRECGENLGPSSSKGDEQTTFVDYKDGVGRFVVDLWIDKEETPFGLTKRLATENMTVNETAVLRLWERLYLIHHAL